jgi:hypothetical protein
MHEFVHGAKRRAGFEKVVLVTRKTRLAELIRRFNTLAQTKFYIEHAGGNFQEYQLEDEAYRQSADVFRRAIELGLKVQEIDRGLASVYWRSTISSLGRKLTFRPDTGFGGPNPRNPNHPAAFSSQQVRAAQAGFRRHSIWHPGLQP